MQSFEIYNCNDFSIFNVEKSHYASQNNSDRYRIKKCYKVISGNFEHKLSLFYVRENKRNNIIKWIPEAQLMPSSYLFTLFN